MKIGFVFGSPKISGGSYVIFQHAIYLKNKGHEVYFLTAKEIADISSYEWHEAFKRIPFVYINKFELELDMLVATWWESPYLLYKVKAKQYAYFVQSIEAYFFQKKNIINQYIAHESYKLGLPVITEASWIKKDLESKGVNNVFLVKNGILKHRYSNKGVAIEKREIGKLRCLVEGPVEVPFKYVKETIEGILKSKADEVWLLTSSAIKSYDGCSRVFSNVDPSDVPKIMRSCDVLVKQSAVEGMFGPPLEMFHCGGTAVVSAVTGYDEYIEDNVNGLVNKVGDFDGMIRSINKLKENQVLLKKLKKNALITACKWPDWDCQSEKFECALMEILKLPKVNREDLRLRTRLVYEYADFLRKSLNNINVNGLAERFEMTNDFAAEHGDDVANTNEINDRVNEDMKIKKILGITISSEHVQEIWHPLINKIGVDYKYVCTKPLNSYLLWDEQLSEKTTNSIDTEKYIKLNWISEPKELYQIIESYAPDVILIHSGNHPAYQSIIRYINNNYEIPILFTELGWLPQKYNFYIDPCGTNANSSIAKSSFYEFCGVQKHPVRNEDFTKNNVLLILQLETDMNFVLSNPYFRSNKEFIEYVIQKIPEKYNIIVKPHPLDPNASYYEKYEDGKRVCVSYDKFDNVITECNSVVAINSTCLIEAIKYPVNIYKCGKSIIDNKELAIDFDNTNLDQLWRDFYINNNIDRKIFIKELLKYQINVKNIQSQGNDTLIQNKSISLLLNPVYKKLFDDVEIFDNTLFEGSAKCIGNRVLCNSIESLCQSLVKYDVISIDVFDTLIRYQLLRPVDIHRLISNKVAHIVNSPKFNHVAYRTAAEVSVRKYSIKNEVSLDEIYAQYLLSSGLPAFIVQRIKELEKKIIFQSMEVRSSGKMLFDFAKKSAKKVCITSDFYIGNGFVETLLANLGFDLSGVDIFISIDINKSKKNGNLYDHLRNKYKGKTILHIGDNFIIDCQQALRHGVDAVHFPSELDTQKCAKESFEYLKVLFSGRQPLDNCSVEESIVFSSIVNNRFDNPFKINRVDKFPLGLEDIGYSVLGPVILSFTHWLYDKARANNVSDLLFLSRDGHLLKKSFDLIYANKNIRSFYLYCSRRVMNIINLSYDFLSVREIIDTRIANCSLKYLIKTRFDIDCDSISCEYLKGTGFHSYEDQVSLPKDRSRVMLLAQKMKKIIIERSLVLKNNYVQYLTSEVGLKQGCNYSVVDIGYFGSMQTVLFKVFKELGVNNLTGYYFATRKEVCASDYLRNNTYGYFANQFEPESIGIPNICGKLGNLEFLLSAPHGSFCGVKFNDRQPIYEFLDSCFEQQQWDDLNLIHNSTLKFLQSVMKAVNGYIEHGIDYLTFDNRRFDIALAKILDKSNPESKKMLSNFVLENMYSLEVIPFNSVESNKAAKNIKKQESKTAIKDEINNKTKPNPSVAKKEMPIIITSEKNNYAYITMNDVLIESSKMQKILLNGYKIFLRYFANTGLQTKFENNIVNFFLDSKSKLAKKFLYIFNKSGKYKLI